MKKIIALLLCFLLTAAPLAACASKETPEASQPSPSPTEATAPKIPSVRYLNFQSELDEAWQKLAADYTAETGVPVTVTTRDAGNWRQTLEDLLSSEDAPSLFQLHRPTAADGWETLCHSLSGTEAAQQLINTDSALTGDGAILALPAGMEAVGIWVNKALLSQAGYTPGEITTREALKAAAEAITADAESLDFAAFTLAGLSDDDLLELHMDLACTAIAWEFRQDELSDPVDFQAAALDALRELLDIMLLNGTHLPEELAEISREAALNEFLDGKAVFTPGTTADWETLSAVFAQEDLALLPIFLDIAEEADEEDTAQSTATDETTAGEDESVQGLCIGAAFYWCVNPDTPEQDLSATLDFLDWCLGTQEGAAALAAIGYDLPYLTAPEAANPFLPAADQEELLFCRHWAMPSSQWKTALHDALIDYTADPTDTGWDSVSEAFLDYWAAEYALELSAQTSEGS